MIIQKIDSVLRPITKQYKTIQNNTHLADREYSRHDLVVPKPSGLWAGCALSSGSADESKERGESDGELHRVRLGWRQVINGSSGMLKY
jgi:hypothetical protein